MVDEWARKRLGDFNLWASGSAALAKEHASLDAKLSTTITTRRVFINLLCLLEALVVECQHQGECKCLDCRAEF